MNGPLDKQKAGVERMRDSFDKLSASPANSEDRLDVLKLSLEYQLLIATDPAKLKFSPVKTTLSAGLASVGMLIAAGLDLDRVLAEIKTLLLQSGAQTFETFKKGRIPNDSGEIISAVTLALKPLITNDLAMQIPAIVRETYGRDPETFLKLDGTPDVLNSEELAYAQMTGRAPQPAQSAEDDAMMRAAQAKFAGLGKDKTIAH